MSLLNIAIIGAGPAGCTLARIILQSCPSINITIYEGEASVNARHQGGTLDLHADTGLAALKMAGLYQEFLKHARFDGESLQIIDNHFRRYVNMEGDKKGSRTGRPEIDRAHLRKILVDSLPEDMIKWNHRLRSIDQDLTLHFDHTTVSGFDLLIGADGAWSKVRPLVSSQTPFFSGIAGLRYGIRDIATTHPDLYQMVRRGSVFSYSDRKFMALQQMGDGSLSISNWAALPPTWIKDLPFDPSDEEAMRAHVKSLFAEWDPRLTKAIDVADMPFTLSDLYMLPIGHSWKHRPRVTLLGDAAHLMTPFAGEGVNLAMKDSMNLATAIIKAANSLASDPSATADSDLRQSIVSQQVELFEKEMFVRATQFQQLTWDLLSLMYHEPGAPDSVIERYCCRLMDDTVPWIFKPLLKASVYAYYFLFRRLGWGYV